MIKRMIDIGEFHVFSDNASSLTALKLWAIVVIIYWRGSIRITIFILRHDIWRKFRAVLVYMMDSKGMLR